MIQKGQVAHYIAVHLSSGIRGNAPTRKKSQHQISLKRCKVFLSKLQECMFGFYSSNQSLRAEGMIK